MEVGSAFTGFATAVETMVGLSRGSRLRRSISANVDLYGRVRDHDDLRPAAFLLADLVIRQVQLLSELGPGRGKTQRDPGAFVVGLSCTVLVALPALWLQGHLHQWWGWPLIILDGLVAVLFLTSSVAAGLTPPRRASKDPADQDPAQTDAGKAGMPSAVDPPLVEAGRPEDGKVEHPTV